MKLSQTITVVALLHIGVVGSLFIFPGCQISQIRPQGDRVSAPQAGNPAHGQGTVNHYPQAGSVEAWPETSVAQLEPTRPTWNISSNPEPEVIEGYDQYEETSFNAINPELTGLESDMETVIVVQEEQTGFTTSPAVSSYTVVKGDNLTRIARLNGVTVNELMGANGLNKNSLLQIGQVLTVPATSGLASSAAPKTSAFSPSTSGVDGQSYNVKRGDTLGAIARSYGTTVGALRSANQLSGDSIYVGQALQIPSGSTPLAALPKVAPAPVETSPGETAYVVRAGDTLGTIARRYDLTARELADRNGISDPRKLRAGATLVIPVTGSTSSAVTLPMQPEISPVPAPRTPPMIVIEESTDVEVIETEGFDFDNLDDIPIVPIQTTE